MTLKIEGEDGKEIEVYTADEVAAASTAAATAKEAEFTPKLTAAEGEKTRLEGLLKDRAAEFAGFRKLSDDQVAKLDEKDRVIYENQIELQKEREKGVESAKKTREATISSKIREKVGTDETLFNKVKEMYEVINIEDATPEQVEVRVAAALGALSTTSPDLLAKVAGFGGGTFAPPVIKQEGDGKSFADSEAGKAGAAELGLVLETPKK